MSARSSARTNGPAPEEPEEISQPTRPLSPPPHLTHAMRGVHTPSFSSFQPRDLRISSIHPIAHVAWNCDGRKLASVGVDKSVRVWAPEKSLETRNAVQYLGGHDFDVDYVVWNPTHPELFCSSSQKDRKVVFWDARQSRCVQSYTHSISPCQLNYSPDGKLLCMVTTNHQLWFMEYGAPEGGTKPLWTLAKRDPVPASTASFNHGGDGLVLSHWRSNLLLIMEYPSLTPLEQPAAHVGGCTATALDPRGKYLASGGQDSIVDLFDTDEWICVNTITSCGHSINALSFSYDGEYLAIASQGSYIDICATETGQPIHRITTLGPAHTVTWHPSKYVFAYCGQTKHGEGVAMQAYMSLFGPGL